MGRLLVPAYGAIVIVGFKHGDLHVMGNCTICGQPAGLLKKIHQVCVDKQKKSKKEILSVFVDAFKDSSQIEFLRKRASTLAKEGGLTTNEALQMSCCRFHGH